MKKLSVSMLGLALLLGTTAAQAKFDAEVNEQVCAIVKQDDKDVLNRTIKSMRLSMNTLYQNVQCDGENILQFSLSNDAAQVGNYIIRKTSRNVLAEDAELYEQPAVQLAHAELIKSLKARIES